MIDAADLRKALGQNVTRLRTERGWTQERLADLLDISRTQLNRIENGHHTPSTELLFSLADVLGVPTDALRQITAAAA